MGITSTIKRRCLNKLQPLLKRLLLPGVAALFLLHMVTWSDPSFPEPELRRSVLPGEALDPLIKKRTRSPHDRRPENAFETVIKNAAAVEDEQISDSAPQPSVAPENMPPSDTRRSKGLESARMDERLLMQEKTPAKAKRALDDVRHSDWSMAKMNVPGHDKVKFPGHKISEATVTLTVMSSADKVFMSLNKREIYRGLTDRGMHIVVLHPHTGKVMAARVFDTFYNGTEEEMVEFLDDVQPSRIVVLAVRDEAASGLTWKGRNKLRELGSRFADKLAFRDMWILVSVVGGLKLAESYSNVAVEDTGYEWGGPLFLRTDFDLDATAGLCPWSEDAQAQLRQKFCQRFEGYGDLCKCKIKNFDEIFFKTDPVVIKEIERNPLQKDLAVAVLASDRPHYLYRTLKALREAGGAGTRNIFVYLEKDNREIAALTKLFGYHLVITGQRPGPNITVPVRVRDKLQFAFRHLTDASFPTDTLPEGMSKVPSSPHMRHQHIVILDEDAEVSIDFFKYLHSVAPVLKKDPTIVGISGFNYNSYREVAESLVDFYRTDRLQTIALLVPRRTLQEYVIPGWPDLNSTDHWHSGLQKAMKKEHDLGIIYPEVSRCKHFGYTGYRIYGALQKAFFDKHRVSLTTSYSIPKENIDRLKLEAYEKWELETIKKSNPISFDFCKYVFKFSEEPVVLYVEYDGRIEHDKYITATLKCLGAWHLYAEGGWRNTWHLRYTGHPLTLVAVPASPYAYLMPGGYKKLDLTEHVSQLPPGSS